MLMQELLPGLSRQKLLLLIVYRFCGGKGRHLAPLLGELARSVWGVTVYALGAPLRGAVERKRD